MKRCPVCYVNDFFDGAHGAHPQYQYFDTSGDFELCSNHIELIEVFNYNTKRIYFYFVAIGMKRLPEQLHNIMLMSAATDNDCYASAYLDTFEHLLILKLGLSPDDDLLYLRNWKSSDD
jgi:hypothetical protein